MIDPKLLRQNQDFLQKKLSFRGFSLDLKTFNFLEKQRKILQIETENLQCERNSYSKLIGNIKKSNKIDEQKNIGQIYQKLNDINKRLDFLKKELATIKNKIYDFSIEIPNIPADDIPIGNNSDANVEIYKWGDIPQFDFEIKDHVLLGEINQGLDFKSAAQITGSRFVTMKGNIARLHRALSQFMMNLHIDKHGYIEMYVPILVNHNTLYNTGHLPKFSDGLFHIKNIKELSHQSYSLIPTAEVPLTNLVQGKLLNNNNLPIKLVSYTPCFRSESGSYGSDTRGLIRMHQFDKVELVQIVVQENSMKTLEEVVIHAETVLQLLKLPYRKILLCTGDLGFSAQKTYDLEVWFPAQNQYREISSCSNMGDFQSRRMKARYFLKNQKNYNLVHTLNGSGLAVGRTLAAVLENYQTKDGCIIVPKVLRSYMNNISHIKIQ